MNYNDIKERLAECPGLAGLDDNARATLLMRGMECVLPEGTIIYSEGAGLDDTFCLLLSGDVAVEKSGEMIGGIFEREVFGEMAYFTNERARTATLRVCSPEAVVMTFKVTPAELSSPPLAALRKWLSMRTWEKFVSTSQNTPNGVPVMADTEVIEIAS